MKMCGWDPYPCLLDAMQWMRRRKHGRMHVTPERNVRQMKVMHYKLAQSKCGREIEDQSL